MLRKHLAVMFLFVMAAGVFSAASLSVADNHGYDALEITLSATFVENDVAQYSPPAGISNFDCRTEENLTKSEMVKSSTEGGLICKQVIKDNSILSGSKVNTYQEATKKDEIALLKESVGTASAVENSEKSLNLNAEIQNGATNTMKSEIRQTGKQITTGICKSVT